MALGYFLDEQIRKALWIAVQQHNAAGVDVLDMLRVGDPPAPPLGTADPDLLLWGEENTRVLISGDRSTMALHAADHCRLGRHTAGVLILRPRWTVAGVLSWLVFYSQSCDPIDMVDYLAHIP